MNTTASDRPLLIVVTPVRNEAWVLDAFLTCASSWADRIIVADQHSTDGSREIASRYEKVILVDNDSPEMDQAYARWLLFQEVDKIEGDKIVFALDADEFLSEGFENTAGWQRILESSPNEIFSFNWLNLYGDYGHYIPDHTFMEWAVHFDSTIPIAQEYHQCEQRSVHEMRVPCLPTERARYVKIDDFKFVHLARLSLTRQNNKSAFYQVHTIANLSSRKNAVSLFRTYYPPRPKTVALQQEVFLKSPEIRDLVKTDDYGQYYIDEMLSIFEREGMGKFLKLDIWENPYLKAAGLHPKLPLRYRALHWYLRKTRENANKKVVKVVDKMLKKLF